MAFCTLDEGLKRPVTCEPIDGQSPTMTTPSTVSRMRHVVGWCRAGKAGHGKVLGRLTRPTVGWTMDDERWGQCPAYHDISVSRSAWRQLRKPRDSHQTRQDASILRQGRVEEEPRPKQPHAAAESKLPVPAVLTRWGSRRQIWAETDCRARRHWLPPAYLSWPGVGAAILAPASLG